MLEWIAEKIVAILTFVPALFVAEDSPQFMLFRAMFGLLLIPLILLVIAMLPSRSDIVRYMRMTPSLIGRSVRHTPHATDPRARMNRNGTARRKRPRQTKDNRKAAVVQG
jgi:hypothetical protein